MSEKKMQDYHLVCPHCQATNRVPAVKLDAAPKCGKCGQSLLTASPQELNAQTTNKVIRKNDILTIVDFWASWCQPCIMMAPQFKVAASQLPQVVFAKLQTDKYEQAAAPYNIRSLPTMVAFKHGREIARQSGALPSDQIVQWVRSLKA
ncbi:MULTISPECIES: thioredoxin domain-containing protein [unclassified Psychrobacter]|uniref:thioredoxin domain-containing protein n=1 Tax=unclassified Psychrobacter TaxID=196806 RepID=UPI001787CAE9|nr:thioredoxin domain-containing protein [Psychrobacter sp. FME13]MBE0443614.1 thiol reductase thioredoxin [Psychrobacter sp. FME13]